jgi:hypothetical protein
MPLSTNKVAYPLTEEVVDLNVEEKIGNYALGIAHKDIFAVQYIGRSDTNLNKRLKDHIGEGYPAFKFYYATNSKEAYTNECIDYHRFIDANKRLDNEIHPDKPKNAPSSLVCPVCGQ